MSDLELLKRYLQNEIDVGNHKLFVFDKDDNVIEFKVIDALNEINNLQSQLQRKENIIKEVRKYIMTELITEWGIKNDGYVSGSDLPVDAITPILEILDKEIK